MSTVGGSTIASSGTSSGISAVDTNIRVVVFSGKKDDWESWKEKFVVKAAIRGYEGILTGEDKVPDTHNDDGTKKTLKNEDQLIADANKKGFGDLILSIDCTNPAGNVAFAVVKGTKSKTKPSGDLSVAFQRLKTKYEPSTTPQLMNLTKEFHSKFLKQGQDPDIFFTELEALQVK